MRQLLLVLLLVFSVCANYKVNAQTKHILIPSNVKTIGEAFSVIEKNSDYILFYNIEVLNPDTPVSVGELNGAIEFVLDQLLRGTQVSYEILARQIVLYKKENSVKANTVREVDMIAVEGFITDVSDVPILGAHVVDKEGKSGTLSDENGYYKLNVPVGATLTVSYLGYIPQEIKASPGMATRIVLMEDLFEINEYVVVGYGTLEKRQITSAITSLSGNDLLKGAASSTVAASLIGKITGLVLHETSSVNSGATLQLRGMGSVNADKEPLVVVDGMPGADIRSVLPEDIAYVDVLKDASAGAIYGSRASSGVILITTKTSQVADGSVKLNYTGELISKQATRKPEVLSAEEYVKYNRGTDYGSRVDWWDESLNDKRFSQRHVFSLEGGSRKAKIYTSMSYEDMQGIKKFEKSTRFSGRINANFFLLDDWLEIRTHADYRQNWREYSQVSFEQALGNNPTRSPYDPNSKTGYNVWLNEDLDYNSIADAAAKTDEGLDKWFKPDVTLKLNIRSVPGLSLQQTIAYENRQWESHQWRSRDHREEQQDGHTGTAGLFFNKSEFLTSEGYMSYLNTFGKHTINATAGFSYWERNGEQFWMENENFTNDRVQFWNIGEGGALKQGEALMYSEKSITEKLLAFFARCNYSYNDKYILAATYRREGSSKFAVNNRWGNFWSVSAGWRLSHEPILSQIDWLNELKLRAGYGVVGNNGFEAVYAATMYGSDVQWLLPNGNWAYSYGKIQNINPDLKWEEQNEWNMGLDYSLFRNRIYGKFDVFLRKSNGLIFDVQVPQPPYTEQTMHKNIGVLSKRGWEFEVGAHIINNKDLRYSTNIGLSHLSQKLVTLWGDQSYFDAAGFPSPGTPGSAIRIEEGVTIGQFHLWKFAGFDENGNWLLYNKEGEVIPATEKKNEDKQYIGNYYPKYVLNWNHTLTYKAFDLNVTFLSYINFDIYNAIDMYYGISNVNNLNVLKKAYTEYAHIKGEKELCDYYLHDGSFLKIQNVNVGYTFDLKRSTRLIEKVRLYLTVNNAYTFTKYGGSDPSTVNITGLSQGIDWHNDINPMARTYTMGLQVTF